MSGHSKWAKLKHFKGAVDSKRSALFTKLGHAITIAAREGGSDPEMNFKLRLAIEKARQANMPKDNVERAIKRGTGQLGDEQIEEATYEAFGPGSIAMIVDVLTDNKNRALASIRRILNKYGGNLGGANSVLWMFERKGIIRVVLDQPEESTSGGKEKVQMLAIEAGAEDIIEEDKELAIYTKPEDLQKIKESLESQGITIDYAEAEWFAKNRVKVEDEKTKRKIDEMYQEFDDDPDISDYYTNLE